MLDISISDSSGVANIGHNNLKKYKPLNIDDAKKIVAEDKIKLIQLFQPISQKEATLLIYGGVVSEW